MEVSDLKKQTIFVWGMGMLRVVFNKQAGNYYSKSTFIMTNKTRETCVHIGYFIHSGVFMCFYKTVYGYPKISNFGYPVPEITENAQP